MNFENKKIRILFVIEQSSISYKYFENILVELQKYSQFNVEVFNLVSNDFVNNHLKQFCNKLFSLPNNKPYKKQLINFKEIIRLSKPDIIHAHEVISSFYAAISLMLMGATTKLIFHRHHSFYRDKIIRIMERIAFFRCNLAISVSKTTQKVAFSEHPFNKKKIIHLYNGITVVDNNLPIPIDISKYKNDYKIVLLARLRRRKGHDTAIDAIDIVRKQLPNIVLFFAGEGDYRKVLENIIAEKKLQRHVILLGDVQNIKPLLKEMDMSILPSESEAFNLSILETFACGKLSMASNLPSIRECIKDGKTGILLDPGNSKQLAEKIVYYLTNKTKRDQIAANGKKLYEQEFTTSVMIGKMINIYIDMLEKRQDHL